MENREGAIADLEKAVEIAVRHKYATFEQKATELLQQIQTQENSTPSSEDIENL